MKTKEHRIAYLGLALLAFLAFALEVAVVLIEKAIYKIDMSSYNTQQWLLHWSITCVLWGISAYLLLKLSKTKLSFNPFDFKAKPSLLQWVFIVIVFALFVFYMTYNWDLILKPIAEFNYYKRTYESSGVLLFIFQMIYYCFESALIFLLIAFAQEFGEKMFKSTKIPWGGILLAVTWGLGHILTKDLLTGILGLFWGVSFGIIYLLSNKNPRYAYPLIALMFIL